MSEITLGNLYDFNKSAMAQVKPLDVIAFNTLTDELSSFIYNKATEGNKYWMFLNNERRDYTVFHPLTKEGILPELRETILNRGEVLDISKREDEDLAYEIWIRDPESKENFVYYIFNYTLGVIEA